MLDLRDGLVLAPGVYLDGDAVVDPVRALRVPLNASAALVLRGGHARLADAVEAVARAYGLPRERARADVLAFALQLNAALLANVVRHGSRLRRVRSWLTLALRLLPAGAFPGVLTRRVEVPTSSPLRAVVATVRALLSLGLGLGIAASLTLLQAASLSGSLPVVEALAAGSGLAAGLVVHEAGHAALLGRRPAALVIRIARVSLVHPPIPSGRRRLVAAGGPLAAVAVGLVLLALGSLLDTGVLAFAGLPLVGHAAGLTVLATDGRNVCTT